LAGSIRRHGTPAAGDLQVFPPPGRIRRHGTPAAGDLQVFPPPGRIRRHGTPAAGDLQVPTHHPIPCLWSIDF